MGKNFDLDDILVRSSRKMSHQMISSELSGGYLFMGAANIVLHETMIKTVWSQVCQILNEKKKTAETLAQRLRSSHRMSY